MNWKLPNLLTMSRIVLALGFFVLLGVYQQGSPWGRWALNVAFCVYIVAGITDILDGYFARKWDQTSDFGRMVDPIVDKVLVLGGFVMLTGGNYGHWAVGIDAISDFELDLPQWLTGSMFSCVQAWMVVAILVRELIISGVRGYSESRGKSFPATYGGKIKMLMQSVAICTVLYQMANGPQAPWAVVTKIVVVWLAALITLLSGMLYIRRARLLLSPEESPAEIPPAPQEQTDGE
jgi:CDP-diacylglycerol---glycerol-3-phosphate 3-phosphatidyltransferase